MFERQKKKKGGLARKDEVKFEDWLWPSLSLLYQLDTNWGTWKTNRLETSDMKHREQEDGLRASERAR